MPNTHETLTALFTDIADAIRAKTGGTADICADDFPTEIAAITGGVPLVDAASAFPLTTLLAEGYGWTSTAEEGEE